MAATDAGPLRGVPELVGRAGELQVLDARVRSAAAGAGQVVLLAGEPGIGKTRLAEETVALGAGLGMPCRWGRAVEGDGGPPFSPFGQLLRGLHTPAQSTTPAAAVPSGLVAAGVAGPGPLPGVLAAQGRFEMFEAVTGLLAVAAAATGLVVVLDDLQWADPGSLQLLVHLTRGLADSRVLVVGAYRDTETGGREALRRALAALAHEPVVTRIRVVGLAEAEVAARLTAVTGRAVSTRVAAVVSRRSQGNPFFIAELARLLDEAGDNEHDEVVAERLPDGVRDAVHARLARLSQGCRSVVCTAAVLGFDVDVPALSALTGHPVEEVLTAVDEASAAGVLTAADGWRFTHDLVREAARAELGSARRVQVHLGMARFLETRADVQGRLPELAFHWLESLPVGDTAWAVRWAERAAEQAMAQLAWEDAAALLGRALHAARATTGEQFTARDLCRLLQARAWAQARGYDMDGARRSLLDLVAVARPAGDAAAIGQAALTMAGLTDALWGATGKQLCEEALALLPVEDSPLRAQLLAQLTGDQLMADTESSPERVEALSREAMGMAERVGDHAALVAALRARQIARSGPDGATERLALGDRMRALGERDGDDDAVLWGRLWRFDALAQLGAIDRAEAELGPIAVLAEQLRAPLARLHLLRSRGAIAIGRGRFAEAVACGQEAVTLAERAGHEGAVAPTLGILAFVRSLTGAPTLPVDPSPAGKKGALALEPAVTALWFLALGRQEDAKVIYSGLPPASAVPGFLALPYLATLADLAAAFDDRDMAAEVYPRLLPCADLFICSGAGVIGIEGSVRLPLGVSAGTLGRLDEAVRHLRAAVEANDRAGCPPFAATARYQLARVLARRRRPGDREEAAALAVSAASQADRLGMAPLHRRAGELSRSLAGNQAGPLTPREREIAVLVADGLTDRQIAAVTHLSERTAENHVAHIRTKLGFASRAQIAAWIAGGHHGPDVSTRPE